MQRSVARGKSGKEAPTARQRADDVYMGSHISVFYLPIPAQSASHVYMKFQMNI